MKRRFVVLALAAGTTAAAAHAQHYETCTAANSGTSVGPGSHAFTTVGAAINGTTPSCAYDPTAGPDVWFLYVASKTGSAKLVGGQCDAVSFATSVYATCSGAQIACSPDICYDAPVVFPVVKDQSYLIRLADYSFWGTEYAGGADLVISEPTPPGNDNCGGAVTLNGPGAYNVVFTDATTDSTSLPCANIGENGTNDVWYRYVAANTGNAIIELLNQNGAATIGVFDECSGTVLDCDKSGYPNRVALHVTQNEDYYIRVAVTNGDTTTRAMTISEYSKPGNDDCSGAVSVGLGTTNWDNTGAIEDYTERANGFSCVLGTEPNASMWFKFTPGSSGTAIIKADATNINNEDPVLEAYSGCGGTSLACNNNIGFFQNRTEGSYIAVPVTATSPIYIRLGVMVSDNYTNYFSSGTLNISIVTPLANDECSGAITLTPGETVINNRDAVNGSIALTQCSPFSPSTKDLWYKWTPNANGLVTIHTCGSFPFNELFVNRNTILSVYENACEVFGDFICNSNDQESHDPPCSTANSGFSNSYLEFNASAGTTYYIRVASEDELNFGLIRLNLQFAPITNVWLESSDAGQLLSSAQGTNGSGTLAAINGRLTTGTDVDLYKIDICDAANFTVTTGALGGNTAFFLFDQTGHGIAFNDHTSANTLAAALSNQFVNDNGVYYLAVTRGSGPVGDLAHLVSLPQSSGGAMWEADPRGVERDPDGTGFGGTLNGWSTGTSVNPPGLNDYTVLLTGVCFAPGGGCAADFNGDSTRDVADLFAYINAWLAKTPNADFNSSGSVDVADLFAYINAWLAGC